MTTPTPSPDMFSRLRDFSLIAYLTSWLAKRDKPFWIAALTVFLTLNLVFLFHGVQYLFGDHDWTFIKQGVPLSAGLFEGRFTQFLLINILSAGEILPLINNVLGFLGYAIGIALLARYWQLPHTKQTYTFFTLFTALSPYLLSFMYFAFLIIPVLSWNAFILGALVISAAETKFSLKRTLSAIALITCALGGYPPVINLFAVALIARIFLLGAEDKSTLSPRTLWQNYRWSCFNFLLALIVYKLFLAYYTHTGAINAHYYNLQTTPLTEWPAKLCLTLKNLILQFWVTLPFITRPYKIIAAALTLCAALTIFFPRRKAATTCVLVTLFLAVFLSGLLTFFISASLKETEFSPRIDFFGFNYAIAAMLALCLKQAPRLLKNLVLLLATLGLIINTHTLFAAQKVWKLGFDAERNLYKRVLKRYETAPLFNLNSHYIMVQGGAPAFRSRYYHTPYTHASDDLLGISYTPGLNAGVMWNFDSPREYADKTAYVYTFKPDTDALKALQTAAPYPAMQSVQVGAYWILVTFSPESINQLRTRYQR